MRSGKQAGGFYKKLWKTILSGAPFSDIFVNQKKDGSLYYEQKTITPLRDQSGKVTNYIATGKDITERMETQERLQFMAHHDSLTTLPNRTLFLDRLTQALARARWHSRQVVIMFVDLDRFKNINDSLGHPVGDRLLKQIGQRLIKNIREGDIVARFGGDEFAVLVDNVASRDLATTIAKNMLDALSPVFRIDDHDLYITASIGISIYPVDGDESSELLRKADIAMYRAKELGKNNYQFFASDMNQRAVERLSLENSLRRAVEENQFELYYQPQVDLATRQIIGVEALIRWNHPQRGVVSPLDFIPLLEETGLIVEVGDWVVEEACRQSAAWVSKGLNPVNMSINLSPRQFYSPDLADRIKKTVEGCGVNPELFEIEITETVLMDNASAVVDTIFSLSDFGIRIALDDFGTGYSSLSYLKRFPIDTVKIDKSFVQDIARDDDDAAIVQAIIVMCERLEISVIAEGVETDEQRDFLKENGCQRIQGYLVGRPVPADQVQRLISVNQRKM